MDTLDKQVGMAQMDSLGSLDKGQAVVIVTLELVVVDTWVGMVATVHPETMAQIALQEVWAAKALPTGRPSVQAQA